jgi:hypothetical protein
MSTTVSTYWHEKYGGCGCGDPETVLELIRDVLTAIALRAEDRWDESNKRLSTLIPDTVLGMAFWYALDHTEVIEHGGYILDSWLTDDGILLLKQLQTEDRKNWLSSDEEIQEYEQDDLRVIRPTP